MAVRPYSPVIADPILVPWSWRHEEALEGLGVLCMEEAHDGTLWFGCIDGIVTYDGSRVSRIQIDEGLLDQLNADENNRRVKRLKVFENGNLLALVGEYLLLRKEGEWRVVIRDTGDSLYSPNIIAAPDGSVWFMAPAGLWRVSDDFMQVFRVIEASEATKLFSFSIDAAGNVWVVKRLASDKAHLIRIPVIDGRVATDREWKKYAIPRFIDNKDAEVVAGQDGLIWYGDRSEAGIRIFDPENGLWRMHENAEDALNIFSLMQGRDGTIWGGQLGKICRIKPGGQIKPYFEEQLPLPNVGLELYETSDKRLWIIGHVGYVYSVDLGYDEWLTYEGLSYQCESENGRQWFISNYEKAVVSHDLRTGTWFQYDQDDGLIERPGVIMISSQGLVWVAGSLESRAAIAVFDGKEWQRDVHPEFAQRIEPKSVYEAMDGTLWFGAGGGRVDPSFAGGALQYGVDENGSVGLLAHHGLPEFPYYVLSLIQTRDRTLWIGSTIIYAYDYGSKPCRVALPFPKDNTIDLVTDQDGTLWAAKEHFGIYRYQDGSWEISAVGGAPITQQLADLLPLSDGTILAASNKGISRFDGTTWTPQVYSEAFGMSSRWSGMQESRDGAIWFSYSRQETKNAMDVVTGTEFLRTVRHRPEKEPPDTRITQYLERVSQPGNSHIQWTARDPWGRTPREKLQYSWRLNGTDWSGYSYETSKTFLNLHHGRHRLEVRARDLAFNVDPTPALIEFRVEAPIWIRPWLIAMVLLIVGGAASFIAMLIHFHDKRLKDRAKHLGEIDRMKTSFFINISHELNTPLTLMAGPLRQVLKSEKSENNRKLLSIALRNAERVSTLASQLLDFRKLEQGRIRMERVKGDIVAHAGDVIEMLQPMAQARGVQLNFEAKGLIEEWFDPDKLKKILQNLVGNAIKYNSAGGAVSIRLDLINDANGRRDLCIEVEDAGPGISPEYLGRIFERFYRIPEKSILDGSGIGLNLTKELVDLWGGEIRAESPVCDDTERPGTRFVVRLPIDGPEREQEE